jgi:hypothetical protein
MRRVVLDPRKAKCLATTCPSAGSSGALLLLLSVAPVMAEEAPLPLVRARVEPVAAVMVGEPVRVVVDVLTPTWFPEPPRFPTLDVKDAFVLFQERGINLTESIGDTSYSGLQKEYLVYPMREGRFEVPPFEVTVVYSIDAKPSKPTPLATVPLSFEATIPAAARGVGYFVSATRLDLDQTLEPQPKGLAVGAALRRTVTVEAQGAFGMMLPALAVPAIDGLSAYPDPPQVEDRAGERGEARMARRVESVAYRLEREGNYELPAVEIAWWDLGAKRLRKAALPAVALEVGPAPTRADEIPLPEEAAAGETARPESRGSPRLILIRWGVPVLLGLIALAWVLPPIARRGRRILGRLAEARARRLDAEGAWFARARRAAANGDAAETYRALLAWAERRRPGRGGTLDAFLAEAADAHLGAEIDRLGESLYGGVPTTAAWTGGRLVERLRAARRREGRRTVRLPTGSLGPLNPAPGPSTRERRTS